MNLEEIKQYLEENKDNEEVAEFIKGFNSVDENDIKAYLDSDEGKKLLQPTLDGYFSKGLETWKTNNLEKLINVEVSKRIDPKDESTLKYEALEKEIEAIKREKLYETLKNQAFKFATENQLPTDLIEYFIRIDSDEEASQTTTMENLTQLKEVWSNQLQAKVVDKLKSSGHDPKGMDEPNKTFTKEQIENMSIDEVNKHWHDSIKDNLGNEQ